MSNSIHGYFKKNSKYKKNRRIQEFTARYDIARRVLSIVDWKYKKSWDVELKDFLIAQFDFDFIDEYYED